MGSDNSQTNGDLYLSHSSLDQGHPHRLIRTVNSLTLVSGGYETLRAVVQPPLTVLWLSFLTVLQQL